MRDFPLDPVHEQGHRGGRELVAVGLGLLAPFVAFLGAALFEVPGQNSIKEIVAGALAVALYCAACQFWLARMGSRGLRRINWPVLGAMVAPLLAVCLLAVAVEGGRTWLVFGLPVFISGCVGSFVGAMLGARGTTKGIVIVSLRSCRRSLVSCATLLVAVALILAGGVIPLVKIDPFPGAAPERANPVFWAIAALNLLAAAVLVLVAVRTTGRSQLSTAGAGAVAFFAVVSGLLLAGPAGGFLAHGPAMHTASILLFLCVAADLIAAVLTATTAFRMPTRA
jgi:hypothetical protein